ncbi:MAG TPA: helix-hairpin-helix domain-containing protein, partial [Herpetosiphonaceae bacterium]
MPDTLTGILERITYRAPDTGYTVARLRPHGKQALVTVVGKLPEVQPGEALELEGAWVEHRAHGRQFEATSYRAAPPTTSEGIVRYLASGLIPGIGPVNAQRIVDTFGPSTLDILDRDPGQLREVKGLGSKKIAAIVSAWEQQRTIKELLLLGQDVGLSTALAVKVFKHFGELAAEIVRGDPYRLANEIEGVGFPTADRIAERLGIARDAPGRITAGLRYTLSQQASETGHCALPAPQLIREAAGLLELPEPTIAAGLDEAAAAVLLVRDVDDLVFLPPFYHAETELANRLRELLATPADVGHAFSRMNLAQLRAALRQEGFALSEAQIEAVALALHSPVTVLTGGPGTGKTTTMRAVLTLLERAQLTVLLAAPTGRAARR